jgi:hypothetical protein
MKKFSSMFLVLLLMSICAVAQDSPSNDEFAPLVLVRIIPMPDVQGRFDHMAVDNKTGRILAAVYGDVDRRFDWMRSVQSSAMLDISR